MIEWAVTGIMELGLDEREVVQVAFKYCRIGMVPTHYEFPEFFKI